MGSRSRRKSSRPSAVAMNRQWQLPTAAPMNIPSPPTTTTTIRRPPQPPIDGSQRPRPVDTSSRAYKAAAWKYTGLMIAMPILLVTSYVLFDRLALGNKAKSLRPAPVRAVEEGAKKEG